MSTNTIENTLHPHGAEHLDAISSEDIREHAHEKLSQLAVRNGVPDIVEERFYAEEHAQLEVGVTESSQRITTDIAASLHTAHDVLLEDSSGVETPETTREAVWQTVLGLQRQEIVEAKKRGDKETELQKLTAHLVTIELCADEDRESYGTQDVSRSQNLEPLLGLGLARDLVEASRHSYGLVVVRSSESSNEAGEVDEKYRHNSVAHIIRACSNDIELGLKQEVSLDPAEAALRDMPDEQWKARLQTLGVREAVGVAVVLANEENVDQERLAIASRRALEALDDYPGSRDQTDNSDVDSIARLAQVNAAFREGSDYEDAFSRLRSSRQVHNHYRSNYQSNFRKDKLILGLVMSGQKELAERIVTANTIEVGDPEKRGVLDWAAHSLEDTEAKEALKVLKEIVGSKRQLLSEQCSALGERLPGGRQSDGLTPEDRVRSLIGDAHDPETAIWLMSSLLSGENRPQEMSELEVYKRLSSWAIPLSWNDEVVFNVIERGHIIGLSTDQLDAISLHAQEIGGLSSAHNEEIVALAGFLENKTIQELLDSPHRQEVRNVIGRNATSLLEALEITLKSDLLVTLLEASSEPLRLKHDILMHTQQWQELKLPTGLDKNTALQVLLKRLELRHPDTEDYLEQPSAAISILAGFEMPLEIMTSLNNLQRQFIGSVLIATSLERLPSPSKEARLKEILPDDDIRQLYIQLYNAKSDNPDMSVDDLITQLMTGSAEGSDLEWLTNSEGIPAELTPSAVLGQMRQLGLEYKQTLADRKRWLKEYAGQNISTQALTNAWQARYHALKAGTADNPSDINTWARENGIRLLLERARAAGEGDQFPTDEQIETHQEFIKELVRVYAPKKVLSAFQRFLSTENAIPESAEIIKPGSTDIKVGEIGFKVEILAKNDPRGMTIGVDTGCCMTLGGASDTCIWAGYEDPRYSFLVLSDANGRVRAQSLIYVNSDSQGNDVLVFDNIEANAGTDLSVIRAAYEAASREFIANNNFSRSIKAVHIGVGYTQEELLKDLEDGEAVPTPLEGTYSDAKAQKVLLVVPSS